jgi:hypothetical protein
MTDDTGAATDAGQDTSSASHDASDASQGDSGGGGGCAHSPCVAGAALVDGCDSSGDDTVGYVCDTEDDTYCCATSWDSQCVSEATAYCAAVTCTASSC